MTNLPILYQNSICEFSDSECAQKAFLWATGKTPMDRMVYKASAFAREVLLLEKVIWRLIKMGMDQHKIDDLGNRIDLFAFIMRRHAHQYFPESKDAWI